MRAIPAEHLSMPGTVIAERVEWSASITWFRDNVRRLRPEHRLWFPPTKIPLEDGNSVLPPVLVNVAAPSRFVTARMIPTRKTGDLLLGSWELRLDLASSNPPDTGS